MKTKRNRRTVKLGIVTEKGVYFDLRILESDYKSLKFSGLNQDEGVAVIDSILTKYLKTVRNLPYSNDTVQSVKLKGWGLPTLVPYMLNEEGQLTRVEPTNDKSKIKDTKEPSIWDSKNTVALISLVVENRKSFALPSVKKQKLWNLIANKLTVQSEGFIFSGDDCDKKWRHLKGRFNEIKRDGRKHVRWSYYNKMKQAMETEPFMQDGNTENVSPITENEASNEWADWDEKKTVALISLVVEKKRNFADPAMRNRDVWNLIANEMQRMGHDFSGDVCNRKWGHLKSRYKGIKKNKCKDIKWQYFDAVKHALKEMTFLKDGSTQTDSSITKEQAENGDSNESSKNSVMLGSHSVDKDTSETPQDIRDETLGEVSDAKMSESEVEATSTSSLKELYKQKNRSEHSKQIKKLVKSSSKRRHELSKIPPKDRCFAKLVRKEQRKTQKLMKILIKEQQRSTSLFEKFLSTIDIMPLRETEEIE